MPYQEHAIEPEYQQPNGYDFDGFGKTEVEQVDGDPIVVVQTVWECRNDHCDAQKTERALYTTKTIIDDEKLALDVASDPDVMGAYVSNHGEVTGRHEITVDEFTIAFGDCYTETIDRRSIVRITIEAEDVIVDEAKYQCNGNVPPQPNVKEHMYPEL